MPRQAIRVRGIVQGVGFRPYVHKLATRLGLRGFVRNQSGCVYIEVEGDEERLTRFQELLVGSLPGEARIDDIVAEPVPSRCDSEFTIRLSDSTVGQQIVVSPDLAMCQDCRAELFDPQNRRYRYPFISCSHCGPRLTIVTGAPYDREQTTLSRFMMCDDCRQEYTDPTHRRFHAQTICCSACGPQVSLHDRNGTFQQVADPIAAFAAALRQGSIGAMKGSGGYHLVCDARNNDAVSRLRMRKHRDEKPLAVMTRDLKTLEELCEVKPQERELLGSPRAPIVLVRRRNACQYVGAAVAPNNPLLGIMLPYTPLQHLLLAEVSPLSLVMTSGNRSDEPIAICDEDAFQRLSHVADCFLTHNLQIHVRCDDSVTRLVAGRESLARRSRGYAPAPLKLPVPCRRSILAVGGQLKATFALGSGSQAILSHHLGDLDELTAYQAFEKDIEHYQDLFQIQPQLIAHDLHPDYASTRYALTRGIPALAVQHHHAHLAGCMAEHGVHEPVVGVIFDGAGHGTDGAIWGGEFLIGDYAGFRRIAHLRYVRMPGGDRAAYEPWRMAAAHLLDAGGNLSLLSSAAAPWAIRSVEQMLTGGFNSPFTSSVGRLFDAVAAITGVRARVAYEGQAAMELEWLATQQRECGRYPWEIEPSSDADWVIDTRPLIQNVSRDMAQGVSPSVIARRLHTSIVHLIVEVCTRVCGSRGIGQVVLSGGVFLNALLASEAEAGLLASGIEAYRHVQVPTSDAGLSWGQLAIAAYHVSNAK